MRRWGADSDVSGRALEPVLREKMFGPSCILGREKLESMERQQEIKAGRGT